MQSTGDALALQCDLVTTTLYMQHRYTYMLARAGLFKSLHCQLFVILKLAGASTQASCSVSRQLTQGVRDDVQVVLLVVGFLYMGRLGVHKCALLCDFTNNLQC